MTWEAWPKAEPMRLAYYVNPDVLRWFKRPDNFNNEDLLGTPQGKAQIVEAIYTTLLKRKIPINYASEKFNYREEFQPIRRPEEVLGEHSPMGTCLDLSLVFCGLCLAHNLLPILIILDGHALVAVALDKSLPQWNGYRKGRNLFERDSIWERGLLTAQQSELFAQFKRLLDDEVFLPVECTGFAHSERLRREASLFPEGIDRQEDGTLTFERAIEAGHEQLEQLARPFQFALDIAIAQAYTGKPYPHDGAEQATTVPFMPGDLPNDFVPRSREFAALKASLLQKPRDKSSPITIALLGAGGFGKTTMALALCHDQEIQDAFLPGGVLWVTLGDHTSNLVGKIEDLIYLLRRERPSFNSLEAATAKLKEALDDRACLLVIDDVWRSSDLAPFLQGAPHCVRLVTTRNHEVLPPTAHPIPIDAMSQDEAIQLLQAGVTTTARIEDERLAWHELATRLGEWPLLLKLANGVLRERVLRLHEPRIAALTYLHRALDKRGVLAFDARNATEREEAVARTLEVSFLQLDANERERYEELAIFPEDARIPLATVAQYWKATGNFDEFATEELCQYLSSLSLLLTFDLAHRYIQLHDVICGYLRTKVAFRLVALNQHFLDSYALSRWADMAPDEPYLWEHLAQHLLAANHQEMLFYIVKDIHYLTAKVSIKGPFAFEQDLKLAVLQAPGDTIYMSLLQHIRRIAHLLHCTHSAQEATAIVLSYLGGIQELQHLWGIWRRTVHYPFISAWHTLPVLRSSSAVRTLSGHTNSVNGCAISADGRIIVSASTDKTLKVWDVSHTGQERFTLSGHTDWVNGCAISADGNIIVSASADQSLKVWDGQQGGCIATFYGDGLFFACALHPDSIHFIAAGELGIYFLRINW